MAVLISNQCNGDNINNKTKLKFGDDSQCKKSVSLLYSTTLRRNMNRNLLAILNLGGLFLGSSRLDFKWGGGLVLARCRHEMGENLSLFEQEVEPLGPILFL